MSHLGCGRLYSIDGNWKLCYPHCMWRVPMEVQGFNGCLQYVDSCPNEPQPGQTLCSQHCEVAASNGVPTLLKEYTAYTREQGKFTRDHGVQFQCVQVR